MIYFYEKIEEETPKCISEEFGAVRMLGKFHIKEHFNMSVIAEVYTENTAKHIVELLNKDSKKRTEEFDAERKKEKEDKQIEIRMKNGSMIVCNQDDNKDVVRGFSQSLLTNLHNRAEGMAKMALEQDMKALWGESIVQGLLNLMDFDNILIWLDEPNEQFEGMTPKEAVNKNGIKCLDDMIRRKEGDELMMSDPKNGNKKSEIITNTCLICNAPRDCDDKYWCSKCVKEQCGKEDKDADAQSQ